MGMGGKDKRTMNEYAVERLLDALQSLTFEVQLFREAYVAHNSPRLERIDEPLDKDINVRSKEGE